jgi:hypothetical protein
MDQGAELLRKLQVKPGVRMAVLNAPAHIAEALKGAPGGMIVAPDQPHEAVLAFCESLKDVDVLSARALAGLPDDGLLWFAYRKGAAAKVSGLSRDVGWAAVHAAGYRPVRSISIDEAWTGLRFREISKVRTSD